MKKNRLTLCLLLLVFVMFSSSSCGFFGDQKYICDVNNVKSVKIVSLDKYVEDEYCYEYTVLCEIVDRALFIEQLNNLDHSVNWGEPSQLDIGYIVIRIDYNNGDYDLLYSNAQWFNRSGVNQYGYFFFDEEQFNMLIADYLKNNQLKNFSQGTVRNH